MRGQIFCIAMKKNNGCFRWSGDGREPPTMKFSLNDISKIDVGGRKTD